MALLSEHGPRKARGSRAYILIETIVALAVLSAGLAAVFSAFSSSLGAAEHSKDLTVATLLAEEKITQLRLAGPDSLGLSEGGFGEDYAGFTWRTAIKPSQRDSWYSVKVEVQWQERGRSRSISLVSLIPGQQQPRP